MDLLVEKAEKSGVPGVKKRDVSRMLEQINLEYDDQFEKNDLNGKMLEEFITETQARWAPISEEMAKIDE